MNTVMQVDYFAKLRWITMRFIVTIIWALLIGGAIAYVLSNMGDEPFNLTQSLTFSAISFIGIIVVDLALKAAPITK